MMVQVGAEPKGEDWVCEVNVEDGERRSRHVVTVTRADLDRWAAGSGREDVEELVTRSFDFLLEREPPSSILSKFDLSVIQRYFPEYDDLFGRQ